MATKKSKSKSKPKLSPAEQTVLKIIKMCDSLGWGVVGGATEDSPGETTGLIIGTHKFVEEVMSVLAGGDEGE